MDKLSRRAAVARLCVHLVVRVVVEQRDGASYSLANKEQRDGASYSLANNSRRPNYLTQKELRVLYSFSSKINGQML